MRTSKSVEGHPGLYTCVSTPTRPSVCVTTPVQSHRGTGPAQQGSGPPTTGPLGTPPGRLRRDSPHPLTPVVLVVGSRTKIGSTYSTVPRSAPLKSSYQYTFLYPYFILSRLPRMVSYGVGLVFLELLKISKNVSKSGRELSRL